MKNKIGYVVACVITGALVVGNVEAAPLAAGTYTVACAPGTVANVAVNGANVVVACVNAPAPRVAPPRDGPCPPGTDLRRISDGQHLWISDGQHLCIPRN
jgi:hypothetical protein